MRWGEGAFGTFSIAAVTVWAGLAIFLITVVGCIALVSAGLLPVAFAVGALGVVALLGVSIISSALNGIFRVAVYQYAVDGATPPAFDGDLVRSAFARS